MLLLAGPQRQFTAALSNGQHSWAPSCRVQPASLVPSERHAVARGTCARRLPPVTAGRSKRFQAGGGAARAASGGGGSGGGGSGGGDGSLASKKEQLQGAFLQLRVQTQLLGTLLVRYPAILGSGAVAAGFFLHLDALGNFHWNAHDAMLGLQCSLPILALDALLMLPNYAPGTTTKVIKIKTLKSVADKLKTMEAAVQAGSGAQQQQQQQGEQQPEKPMNGIITSVSDAPSSSNGSSSSSSRSSPEAAPQQGGAAAGPAAATPSAADGAAPAGAGSTPAAAVAVVAAGAGAAAVSLDEEMVEVEKTISVRADQHPVLAALHRIQLEKAVDNVGRFLWFPLELVLLLMWHFAEEMAYRAILLTWLVGWTIDRLYEAGADDTLGVLGWQLATPQAGAVLAAVGCTAFSLTLLVQRNLFPLQLLSKAEKELDSQQLPQKGGGGKGGVNSEKERTRMRKVLEKVKQGMVRQRRWSTAVEGTRDVAEWAAYSASYLLTGNLLAPYLTAVTSDLVFSGYQRLKKRQVDKAQEQTMQQIRELTSTAIAMRDARKAALQPRPPSAAAKGQDAAEGKADNSVDASNGGASGGQPSQEGSSEAEPAAAADDAAGAAQNGAGSSKSGQRDE